MRKNIIILCTLIIAIPCFAFAEVSVSLRLNRSDAALVDSIRMTVSITGSRDSDEPQIAGIENFLVQKGGRSSQMQIINGRVSSNLDFTYYIQPKRIGVFDIGPAKVNVNGKIYQSNSEKLTVKNSVDQKGGANDPLFLTATLSKASVFPEEQILYTLRLYYIPQVSNASLAMPETDGIVFKQLSKPVEYSTTYNSKTYQVLEIKYSLTPSKPGQLNINPAKMSMAVHGTHDNDNEDFFSRDDFFADFRGKSITLASNALILNVLPVPDFGKPADYTGLVGSYRISAKLEPARLKAGESATLTVTLQGSGNFNRAPELKIPDIENLKLYSDEPKLDTRQTDKGLEGEKIMKWALVPVKEGQYRIPQLSISYFDSIGRYYNIIRTMPFVLIADPGTGEIAQSPFIKSGNVKAGGEIEELGKDILPIHKSVKELSDISSNKIGILSWLFLFFPISVYSLVLAYNKIVRMTPRKEAQLKAFRASSVFYKQCKDKDISADILSKFLKDYINDRFSTDMGVLTPSEAAKLLKEKGCSDETLKQMEWVLKKIETLIFTGKGEEPCDLAEEATLIVKSIDKETK
jgi:hypothetical protein